MPDENGYPTDEDIIKVRAEATVGSDPLALVEFIKSLWHWPQYIKVAGTKVLRLQLHTGGWSGNESIVEALEGTVFWSLYWTKSEKGGHYYFKVRRLKP